LQPDHFNKFTSRFRAKGMKAGVSILLYGKPGTGKTETVLQLSRATGRSLLTADASKIRDKWVGETEKNIRQLFQEYRKSVKGSKQCPILLFNEADAVFGVRRKVNDRGDQMENSLQNILLEELENFEGIFIATTNMETNFDSAFDRRFLYKFKFDIPSSEATKAIWGNKFPNMDKGMIAVLSDEFKLTGAQIENIRKKTEVDLILHEDIHHDLSYFQKLAKEELRLQRNADSVYRSIGFVKRQE
jgi:SpoVK/Ycf46/Vps4 family AAA+-type ATPase